MASQIARKNGRVLKRNVAPPPPTCNCRPSRKADCPLPGKCTASNVCYHCKVVREDNHVCENYCGQTKNAVKLRITRHKTDAEKYHPIENNAGMSKLSQYVGGLIFNNIPWSWSWSILRQSQAFSPISNRCDLCLWEKFYIMYHPEFASLNLRSELYGYCRHKESHLLLKAKT